MTTLLILTLLAAPDYCEIEFLDAANDIRIHLKLGDIQTGCTLTEDPRIAIETAYWAVLKVLPQLDPKFKKARLREFFGGMDIYIWPWVLANWQMVDRFEYGFYLRPDTHGKLGLEDVITGFVDLAYRLCLPKNAHRISWGEAREIYRRAQQKYQQRVAGR